MHTRLLSCGHAHVHTYIHTYTIEFTYFCHNVHICILPDESPYVELAPPGGGVKNLFEGFSDNSTLGFDISHLHVMLQFHMSLHCAGGAQPLCHDSTDSTSALKSVHPGDRFLNV